MKVNLKLTLFAFALVFGLTFLGLVLLAQIPLASPGGTPVASSLTGTSASIGGGLLTVGTCASGTATVAGATTSMVAVASPNTYAGDGDYWVAYVSSANTVTVKVCATATLTPGATTYNVRVIQ